MKKKFLTGFPFIVSLSLFILIFMKIFFGEGCSAEGCKAAANLLSINELYLDIFGASFFLLLSVLSYLEKKISFNFVLISGFLFEGVLYSYQIKSGIFCPVCTGVFLSLVILSIISLKELSLLIFPPILAIFILSPGTNNPSFILNNKVNLISSSVCPHCKKVERFLSKNHIIYQNIGIKSHTDSINFLKHFGFRGIPVLIFKTDNSHFKVIYGVTNIERFFDKKHDHGSQDSSFYHLKPVFKNHVCVFVNPHCK